MFACLINLSHSLYTDVFVQIPPPQKKNLTNVILVSFFASYTMSVTD